MSLMNYQSNHKKSQSGSAKVFIVIALILLLILVVLGCLAYTKSKNMWPFGASSSTTTSQAQAKPSVEISKLAFESNVLSVGVKLHNVTDDGHCVLIVSSKTTGLTIDDSKVERSKEAQDAFKDCTGWNVGAENLPAGEYNVEVKFVGPTQKLSATKMVTKE